jgi:SAM-dependent methyltransferase
MQESSRLRAGAWERSVAEQWARDAAADGSLRHRLIDELCMSIESLVRGAVSDGDIAASVIAELLMTLRHCDQLDFKTEAQCLAYVCWHLADRYGRTQQALDALFAGGHLPVRIQGASILEVGSGPAPAVYAAGDYYRHLSRWCADSGQPRHLVPLLRADTLDRGPGWGRLLHTLSELRLLASDKPDPALIGAVPFSTTYPKLRAFSVRGLHREGIRQEARSLQDEFDRDDEYLSDQHARQLALESGAYPPSAYDLIVMCNFLTNTNFATDFAVEIRELADSLTPGGILLVLGATGGLYPQVYAQLDRLVIGSGRPKPKLVLKAELEIHENDSLTRRRVAAQIIKTLNYLEEHAPAEFAAVRPELPKDVQHLDVTEVRFGRFAVRAYKREGSGAFSARERRRMARRRTEQPAG